MKYFIICLVFGVIYISNNARAVNKTNTLEPTRFSTIHKIEEEHSANKQQRRTDIKGLGALLKWGWQKVTKSVSRWLGIQKENRSNSTLLWAWIISILLAIVLLIIAFSGSGLAAAIIGIVLYVLGLVFGVLGLILFLIWLISSSVS